MNAQQLRNSILQQAIQGKLVPPACRQAGKTPPTTLHHYVNGIEVWYTYVIECDDGSFYKGFTEDLTKRYQQHCNETGAEHTRKHKPKQLYYWEIHYSQEDAIAREKWLKSGVGREWFKREVVESPENWQPASVLLQRIRKEKECLVKEGKLKKKDLESKPIEEDEIPFEIPMGWEWVKIEDITIPIGNKTNQIQSKEVLKEGKVPVVSQGKELIDGYSNEIDKTITESPLIMFGDHTRNVKYIDFPFVIGADGTKFFKPILCDARFLYYLIFYIASKLRDRGYARHYSLLKEEPLPLPPLAEQRRIVAKIEELMPLVERYGKAQQALDQLNESLPARLRQSILQEAIQGRLEPQDPKEGRACVNDDLLRIPKKLSVFDDYLFDIPETWRWCKLFEVADVIGGFAFQSGDLKYDYGYRVIRISDVTPQGLSSKNIVRCNKNDIPDQYQIKEKDILIAMTGGTVGKSLLLESSSETMYLNQRVAIIRARNNTNCYYLDLLVKSQLVQGIIGDVKNSTNDNISMTDILSFPVPLPPLSEQKRIVAKVEELFGVIKK